MAENSQINEIADLITVALLPDVDDQQRIVLLNIIDDKIQKFLDQD